MEFGLLAQRENKKFESKTDTNGCMARRLPVLLHTCCCERVIHSVVAELVDGTAGGGQ